VGKSTGEKENSRIEGDDAYKSLAGEHDKDTGQCFGAVARTSVSSKNGTLNLFAILLRPPFYCCLGHFHDFKATRCLQAQFDM